MHTDPAMSALNGAISLDGADALLSSDMDIVINQFSALNGDFEITSGGDVLAYANDTDALEDSYIHLDNANCSITAAGSIEQRVITAENGSYYSADAGANITVIDESAGIWAQDSTIELTAGGYMTYNVIVLENSSFTAQAAGSCTVYGGLAGLYALDSTADITAGGDITYNVIQMLNSGCTATSGGSYTAYDTSSSVFAEDSTIDITAAGEITYTLTWLENSSYTAVTGGTFSPFDELANIVAADSGFDVMADGDIAYTQVNADSTDIALRTTGGNIFALNEDSYVKLTGDTSTIVLSALYDIARQDMHMLSDINENVTLNIEHVEDYWIDSVDIPITVFTVTPVYGGLDENGNEIIDTGFNEFLGNISFESLDTEYKDMAAEEWAGLVAEAMARAEWLALAAAGSIENLIQDEKIGAATLSEYLEDDTITEEFVAEKLEALRTLAPGDAEYDDALLWLNDMETQMRQAIVDKENLPVVPGVEAFVITDEMAADILEMIIYDNYLGTIDDVQGVITVEMYDEFITAITDRIKELIASETDPDAYDAKDITRAAYQ